MAGKGTDIYQAADRAIQDMNRLSVRWFGELKLAKFDEVHIIREVKALYRKLQQEAERRLYGVCFEAYLLMMAEIGTPPKEAHRMAEDVIDEKWVKDLLSEPDSVTLYRFDTETERKAQRLIEALAVIAATEGPDKPAGGPSAQIDRAMRDWSRQFGQQAIGATDAAAVQALQDAEIARVMWITERDGRVCHVCKERDSVVYDLDEVPPKPHYGCRCRLRPVRISTAQS